MIEPYSEQVWANGAEGGTPVSATRLAHMEDGIRGGAAFFNAASFGALGDGATDDTAALNAALTAAAGSVLFLPAGAYMVSAPLVVPSDTTMLGVYGQSVIKAVAGSSANPLLLSVANVSNVLVDGIVFDGNQANVTSYNNVVTVFTASRIRFNRCQWLRTRGIGVIFSTSITYSGVCASYFEEVGSYNKISGLSADRRQGVAFSSGTQANNKGNFANDNVFVENGLDCVSATNQVDFVMMGNRILSNYAGGFYVSTSKFVRVVGNYATGSSVSGNGIDVNASSEVTITGNECTARGGGGIQVADSQRVAIVGNVCTNNWQSGSSAHEGGITLGGSSGDDTVTISGNVCTDTQGTKTQQYGVHILALAHTNIWVDDSNQLAGNVVAPIGPMVAQPSSRTPTWTSLTVGNGTVACGTVTSKEHVDEHGSFTFGSTTAVTGSIYVALPTTPHGTYQPTNSVVGEFSVFDTSASLAKHGLLIRSGSAAKFVFPDGTALTNGNPAWSGGWASGDQIHWHLDYIPA